MKRLVAGGWLQKSNQKIEIEKAFVEDEIQRLINDQKVLAFRAKLFAAKMYKGKALDNQNVERGELYV